MHKLDKLSFTGEFSYLASSDAMPAYQASYMAQPRISILISSV